MFKKKQVLVTGGAGFVGTNLILKLLESDAIVTATLHKTSPQIKDRRIRFITGDLRDKKFCQKAVRGKDYVFMCAANTSGAAVIEKTPLAHVTPNIIMNVLMLDASYEARVKKFLFISSSTVYPPFVHAVKEEEMLRGDPFEKYFAVSWMKRYSEILCEIYARKVKNPMPVVIVRPANMYGPYDDFNWETSHVIPALIRKVVERHDPVDVWGDGTEIKDLIFIADAVEGMVLAMKKINLYSALNIGTGRRVSISDVVKTILKIDGYDNANIKYDSSKPTMIPKRLINVSLAKELLGFEANTSLKEGLGKTIDWYRQSLSAKKKQSFAQNLDFRSARIKQSLRIQGRI